MITGDHVSMRDGASHKLRSVFWQLRDKGPTQLCLGGGSCDVYT
jgi:hypothetical protein